MYRRTPKQTELAKLMAAYTFVLAEGGSRSGKTIELTRTLFNRAVLLPGTDHLIGRLHFSDVKSSIGVQTVNTQLKKIDEVDYEYYLHKTDWVYNLPNGSRVWLVGWDTKERVDKILGMEFATIYANEVSDTPYETIELLTTRLNPPDGIKPLYLFDQNPGNKTHWTHKVFHERKFPDGSPVPENDYKYILMNPKDNPHLSPQYIERLNRLSANRRRRFLEGEYQDDIGNLFKRAWFRYEDKLPEFTRIVIGVDPAGSVDGDEIGIIVAGLDKSGKFWILDDYSLNGTPKEWADAVASAYEKWQADLIVAEKNYGGDMVESTIKTGHNHLNVELITSSRGKIIRAEPISALYEQGKVLHRQKFFILENEYCDYAVGSNYSPNRMDAAVFALNELSGNNVSILDAF